MRDLNLLRALDALLAEGSVAAAARRLGLSTSAMSRTLARLREATGDPLLVRAGRGMVLTPHAEALKERVPHLAAEVETVLRPAETLLDPAHLQRDFVIRANDGFIAAYGATLLGLVRERAPGVRLLFAQKEPNPARALRDGLCDLELGILRDTAPELKVQRLTRDYFVGVTRPGHPLAARPITARDFAESDSIVSTLHQPVNFTHVVDRALAEIGLKRRRTFQVPSFLVALSISQQSDLVAILPHSYAMMEKRRLMALGLEGPEIFDLPFETGEIVISLIWHPRMDRDPANRWLRELVRECTRMVGAG
ncbi:LysR family transcriptional regulator [Thioclava kandeliae]|uniref:LysR family transcriptional regulator n=2 Tax=Thioclava TaxID=285107 RepID=A0ABV1SJZ8_9RHOB